METLKMGQERAHGAFRMSQPNPNPSNDFPLAEPAAPLSEDPFGAPVPSLIFANFNGKTGFFVVATDASNVYATVVQKEGKPDRYIIQRSAIHGGVLKSARIKESVGFGGQVKKSLHLRLGFLDGRTDMVAVFSANSALAAYLLANLAAADLSQPFSIEARFDKGGARVYLNIRQGGKTIKGDGSAVPKSEPVQVGNVCGFDTSKRDAFVVQETAKLAARIQEGGK